MVDTAAFEAFWKHYPRRVGKLAAIRAYEKARRLANAEEILAGVERYKRTKPQYADWAHPSSWLNAGRWMDEDDAKPVRTQQPCTHTPPCYNVWACLVKRAKEEGRV